MADKKHLTIVTNTLNAAMALSENTSNRLILPGEGEVVNAACLTAIF